ncbi:MAG: glycosyltransferase family 2 protein [Clostridia bacterium]|nr:glycosyltransferase family 2 protein [Clostridia bacterium]
MKLITFAVPSYNSQDYLANCVESLLKAGDDCEIIIVNDGSKDKTAEIADEYANKYPDIVKVIHKENGGHGSGVNAGLKNATGMYYKVVDSDDWLDGEAIKVFMEKLREHVKNNDYADLYICNFVYDHVEDQTTYVSHYRKKFPVDRFFTWKEIRPLRLWKMLLMHSLYYRTEALRATGVVLPEHTFYVDNIFAYQPLHGMKKLYYMDIDLYHYFIGRSDQSVNIANVVKRYEQQIRVMDLMFKAHTYDEIRSMCRQERKLSYHILRNILMNTAFFTMAEDSPQRRALLKKMWQDLKERDKKLYRKMKYRSTYALLNPMPWKMKGWVTTASYKFLCKHVKLG